MKEKERRHVRGFHHKRAQEVHAFAAAEILKRPINSLTCVSFKFKNYIMKKIIHI